MGDRSKIEWLAGADGAQGATWNPIVGCSRVSHGCKHCYAERTVMRFQQQLGGGLVEKGPHGPRWTGKVAFLEHRLEQPLRWRRPRRIFVASLADPFHEAVPDGWLVRILDVIYRCPQHTFILLTKRPARMRNFMRRWGDLSGESGFDFKNARGPAAVRAAHPSGRGQLFAAMLESMGEPPPGCAYPTFDWLGGPVRWPAYPLNLWLGISAEDQATADQRIPILLDTPAARRVLSAEPLLGPIDLTRLVEVRRHTCGPPDRRLIDALTGRVAYGDHKAGWTGSYARAGLPGPRLDWVIAGSESGPGARPCDLAWVRHLRDQCEAAGVPFFWKQHVVGGRKIGTPDLDGRTWDQVPGGACS